MENQKLIAKLETNKGEIVYLIDNKPDDKNSSRFLHRTEKQIIKLGISIPDDLITIKQRLIINGNVEVLHVLSKTVIAKSTNKPTSKGKTIGYDSFVYKVIKNKREL